MEGPSTSVVNKSKSSNTALATRKAEKRPNKKSKSYGQFEPDILKKRGVYVEKNNMTSIIENNIRDKNFGAVKKESSVIKAPPRPRPGKKKFLDSVLAILSKTTISTQFPATEDTKSTKKKLKTESTTFVKERLEDTKIHRNEAKTKKNKFRSKILNQTRDEPEVLLRPKKELGQTSSSFSQRSSRWSMSGFRTAVDNSQSQNLIQNFLESDGYEIASIAKEVLAGQNTVKKVASPVTLVNDFIYKEPIKEDKKLYNFFVDLLETTFSVYNVKTEYDAAADLASAVSSKIDLEIDEGVAKKLNIGKEQKLPGMYDIKQIPSYNVDDAAQWTDKKLFEYFETQKLSSKWSKSDIEQSKPCKRRDKSDHYFYPRTINRYVESLSAVIPSKKNTKRKKNLLNMLKEQLTEVHSVEQPTNFYQALKVMARNKRKCQKTIQFVEPDRQIKTGFDSSECVLKRRRVLSNLRKSTCSKAHKRIPLISSNSSGSELSYGKKINEFESPTDSEANDESYHSIEVYGYDYYEPVTSENREQNQNKQFFYADNESRV